MTEGASRSRRWKVRHVRSSDVLHDLVVVIRAAPDTLVEAAGDIAGAAQASAEVYVIQHEDGFRELLYGVSVYARRRGVEPDILQRFSQAPAYLAAPVGRLRAAGFPVLPTGSHADHFDVQLAAGHGEEEPSTDEAITAAAWRLVTAAGDLQVNPFYAGTGDPPPEDS